MTSDIKLIKSFGKDELARVYVMDLGDGQLIECVESIQPPLSRDEKWVLLVSTSIGCPVKCQMCDAGMDFHAHLTADQIHAQISFLVAKRYPDLRVPVRKFKIQFARMGEPAFNPCVLDVLRDLPATYHATGLMPCLSTIAPRKAHVFMEDLIDIKNDLYPDGHFQMQFSIHSTDEEERDRLMPVPKLTLEDIREYGDRFIKEGDRKITLNFALAKEFEFDVGKLKDIFSPKHFMFKITPLNPTYSVQKARFDSYIDARVPDANYAKLDELRDHGFDVLISIGANEENLIGSNCGQYVLRHLTEKDKLKDSYLYVK